MKKRNLLMNAVSVALAMIMCCSVFFVGKICMIRVYTAKADSSTEAPSSPDPNTGPATGEPDPDPDPVGDDEEVGTPGIDFIRDEDEEEDDYDYAKYIEALFCYPTLEYVDDIEDPLFASTHLTTQVPYGAGHMAYIDCYFNSLYMSFDCTISTSETNETVNFTEPALVTDKGELTCTISDDETEYNIADYHDCNAFSELVKDVYFDEEAGRTDPLSANTDLVNANRTPNASVMKISLKKLFKWLPPIVKIVVVVFVVVAETAEQIKARDNYRHNQSIETYKGNPGQYIYNQNNSNCADYRFGFTNLPKVGCAPISVYNLLVSLGQKKPLSEVIFKFEKWAIEFAVGFGYLGSNPADMYRYFLFENIRYTRYLSATSFFIKAQSTSYTNFIMARWNQLGTPGAHVFFVNRETSSGKVEYAGYNFNKKPIERYDNIAKFNDGLGFIAGYIIRE